jgi:hypothetical protein
MAKFNLKGIDLVRDVPGDGPVAEKGSAVIYNARFFLRRGDEVTRDAVSIAAYRSKLNIRTVDGVELIDHVTTLGKRQPIAAVDKSLIGMQAGGYREVRAGAHLCYGSKGIDGVIPPNAMLHIKLWVNHVRSAI